MNFVRTLNILLNVSIFIDYYLMIKNPFYPGNLRVKWYILGATCLTVIYEAIYFLVNKERELNIDLEPILWVLVLPWIYIVLWRLC